MQRRASLGLLAAIFAVGHDGGNLISIAAAGASDDHSFAYSPFDDPSLYTPPDLGDGFSRAESWDYDADGAMTREVLGDGTELVSTFNAASGRLEQIDISDGTQVVFRYQASGLKQLASVSQSEPGRPDVGLVFGYQGPELNAITYTESAATLGTVAYDSSAFHSLGQIVETIDAADPVTFAYDADELLVAAGALAITRDPQNGRATGASLDGLSASFGYEVHGDPSSHACSPVPACCSPTCCCC